jgi:hypothetical protein
MSEQYYEQYRNVSGDPTAGMDASGNEPWTKDEEDIIRPEQSQQTEQETIQ